MGSNENIQGKMENPITIRMGEYCNHVLKGNTCEPDCPTDPGVKFGHGHYGFIIIVDEENKQSEYKYKTQTEVAGVCMKDGVLEVHEYGKYFPWEFELTGKLKRAAKFYPGWRPDLENAWELFCATPAKNPELFYTNKELEEEKENKGSSRR